MIKQKQISVVLVAGLCFLLTACEDSDGIGNKTIGGILQGVSQASGLSKLQPYQPAIGQVGQVFIDNGEKLANERSAPQSTSGFRVPLCPVSGCPTTDQQAENGGYHHVEEHKTTYGVHELSIAGNAYYNGDMKEALKWYKVSAERGNAVAQFKLGMMYYEGKGVNKNSKKARYWIEKAASQGNVDAQEKLDSWG